MLINDEKLHAVETAEQELLPGVMIRHVRYRRTDGSEFAASAVIAEASAVRLISGTAGGGYELMDSVDFVPEQMRSAILGGAAVVAGINAGYFRRKYHPYKLLQRIHRQISKLGFYTFILRLKRSGIEFLTAPCFTAQTLL